MAGTGLHIIKSDKLARQISFLHVLFAMAFSMSLFVYQVDYHFMLGVRTCVPAFEKPRSRHL
jgi:hypothetical protein